MVINMSTELCSVVKRELLWIEQFAKNYELSRRASFISACKTEEAQKEIASASEAFTYVLNVDLGNRISLERIPAQDRDVPSVNHIIDETLFLMRGFINDLVQDVLVNSDVFKQEVIKQIEPQIVGEFKEVFK